MIGSIWEEIHQMTVFDRSLRVLPPFGVKDLGMQLLEDGPGLGVRKQESRELFGEDIVNTD